MLGRQSGCRPPRDYVDYLTWAGDTRAVLYGMSLSPREADSARETAEELEGDAPALDLGDRFFIAEHQGYIVWYFKRGDPAVYRYMEGDPAESVVADSFADFLHVIIDRAVENRRMHEERTR
ncbi:SMI1/KNR4 family protein [Nocardiopsis suaedae]|uniref:SMI1/KNR4 family protein n=1 Tax=Nocardiopsis suaedae TaxID=3018444 RepID=A0ABT4TV31_9ACTN|nr:SMI1/KNR4 family protein [Nocardiopsis suaedae]MDA2808545.1 SMI1/KNR4 family protein [Nocardiopsis suaedae]